jgi:polyisoprenyl-phosphate glycosyltransferase
MDLSIVVPVYNSQATLAELHRRLVAATEAISAEFEIIMVDDSSVDDSWSVIREIAAADVRVKGISLTRNFGQHAATICGISKTTGDWVVTLDDDLQQRPEDIPDLVARARSGMDLVYGYYKDSTHSWFRRITSNIIRSLFSFAIPNLFPRCSSFRIIRGAIARTLPTFESPYPFVDGFLSWLTHRYVVVDVKHDVRSHGGSNYNFRKLASTAANIFITFSDVPLKLASLLGLVSSLAGAAWLAVILAYKFFFGIGVSGYASLMAGVIFFGGVQLLILGIFGEYLGRMNFRISRKPTYLVSKET